MALADCPAVVDALTKAAKTPKHQRWEKKTERMLWLIGRGANWILYSREHLPGILAQGLIT
ncbi:hypothetical protein [Sporomusa termitida]|uniref:hypothetical protein n=1 Tax=Sporomusa termitida TaxID=2377 RepID=UPI00147964CA|nr:hypothetical protein [Sporomusa termitida]